MEDQEGIISIKTTDSSYISLLTNERNRLLFFMILSILITVIYACLKDPFTYTFSKIGNYFGFRGLYIIWATIISFCFQYASLKLFNLTHYTKKFAIIASFFSSFFLIITAIIPSLKDQWYTLHVIHKWTTFFYVMSMITALHPFFVWLARSNPNLVKILRNWQLLILAGSISSLLIQGQTGIFELWFYFGLGTLLIYLTCTLYSIEISRVLSNEQRKK